MSFQFFFKKCIRNLFVINVLYIYIICVGSKLGFIAFRKDSLRWKDNISMVRNI